MFIHRGRLPGARPASRHIRTLSALLRRAVDENDDENNDKHKNDNPPNFKMALIVVGVIIGISVLALAWVVYRRWQRSRTAKYSRSGRDDNDHTDTNMDTTTPTTTAAGSAQADTGSSTVDRNTSVRSVMTLPKPLENEHVLGREGERDGIDVVIEMPTAEVEEELREEEMDALYRIRLARRRQLAEREERRLARRDARTRNDQAALQALREQTRAASTTNDAEIQALRNEHERVKETRQRAISSVSYADLGVARHDGTRIRANSTESERVGLLSDAASMAASARSPLLPPTNQSDAAPADGAEASAAAAAAAHRRGRSASSVLSIDTTHSDGVPSVHPPRTSRSRTSSHSARHTRAGSSPELIDAAEADAGSGDNNNNDVAPAYSPPGYDEVSLNDALTPAQSRSASPYAEPPPVYTGPTEPRASAESNGAAAAATPHRTSSNSSQHSRRASRASGIIQLPSLRLAQLPQIVIEPSSAVPRDNDEAR
ncbi:hypothetical protein SPI_04902 [Niveomyces insectorum RCEF 264]|uniref:Uncharacterized protein n=1 Tax=Niveomyces insectorum RCEF 264 TaxID=1081102 RepID=A0A167UYS8_9HYPO|nr:hypothetical protein SPI_04902 [Niveomyces insectorum RCEF 264]